MLMQGTETAAVSIKVPAPETSQFFVLKLTVTDAEGLSTEQHYSFRISPVPVISGIAFKGPLAGARVIIYQPDGTVIGEAITATDGRYRIKNYQFYEGIIIAEVTGGTYESEATGQSVTLEQPLQAATDTSAARMTTLNITPLTELAVRRAKMLGTMLTKNTIEQANRDIAFAFGLRRSLVFYPPTNLLDPSGIFRKGDNTEHALAIAAMMVAINTNAYSLTDWLEMVSRDLSDDGRLDDVNLQKVLYQGLNDFIRSPLNVLGVTPEDTQLDERFSGIAPPEIISVTGSDGFERQLTSATVQVKDTSGVSYDWYQTEGPHVTLFNRDSSRVTFKLPNIEENSPETITLAVTVENRDGLMSSSQITLQIQPYSEVAFDKIIDSQLRRCVEDLAPKVRDIGDLNQLECGPDYAGISQFDGLAQFTHLNHIGVLAKNQITDVSALVSLSTLKSLALQQTVMTDLTVLKALTSLTELALTHSPWLTDFSALPQLTQLIGINLYGTGISDGHIFLQMNELQKIAIGNTQISDFSFFREKPNLISLELADSGLTQLDPIGLAYQTELKTLDISGNPLTDISALSGLTKLQWVNLSDTNISMLPSLEQLSALRNVYLNHTHVTDLSALRVLPELMQISLQGFKGTDISPLIDLKQKRRFSALSRVDLTGAVHVPCSQMTTLKQLNVNIFVDVNPGVTCTAD
ncbi:hypothetical protein [Photobacterium sp. GJ3]|uniref:leucine-rich repeat domain-containing protein n=1 Tax=Photobacterium sp. GJ3 TaxID=2829502 RepID=UPI0035302B17